MSQSQLTWPICIMLKNTVHKFQNTFPAKRKLEHRNHKFATFSLSELKGITQEEKKVLNQEV